MQNLIFLIVGVIVLIILLIVFISVLISKNSQSKIDKLVDEITNESPFRKSNPNVRPHNEPLARNKLLEQQRKEELESAVSIYDPKGLNKLPEEVKIVGIAEPKGFWSRFIMGQKLSYIMARMQFQNNSPNSGFWANLIKAQSASQGKSQGRGR